jgi:hypothetical protein
MSRASTSFFLCSKQDVDGRDKPDKPGHDDVVSSSNAPASELSDDSAVNLGLNRH